ncbi:MAG TPA: beta-galactosidase trimerization domain-containing protein [bacterium]|nr:beta-galactosidase trimerization domain-containing protein [bacterium]
MKKVLMFLVFLSFTIFAGTDAYFKDTDGDGKDDVLIMENEYYRITFTPQEGAKAKEVLYKPANKIISTTSAWFQDHQIELGDMVGSKLYYCNHSYNAEIIKKGPDICEIKFYANLPGVGKYASYKDVLIERTYKLNQNSPIINVSINVKNNSKEALPFTLMVGHWAWIENEDSWYFVPDDLGVINDFDSQVRTFSAPVGSQEPTSNFTGFISVQSKLGLIFVMDWKYLDAIECWLSKGKGACIQWPYRKQNLRPGEIWSTRYIIYPVENIESIEAADENYTLGITVGSESGIGNFISKKEIQAGKEVPVKVYISGPYGGKIKVEYGYRILPEEKETIIGSKELQLDKIKGTSFQFPLLFEKKDCTYVVKVRIKDEKNNILEGEKPVKVGDSSYTYFMKRKPEPQIGEKYYGYQIINPPLPSWYEEVDLKVETPHTKWAKPWCNGKMNVLFVNRSDNSVGYWREIWQRCDIDFDCCSFAFDEAKKYPYTQNTLKKLLKLLNEKNYDVIFFAGLHWDEGIPQYIQDSIFSFIKKGKGAVILGDLTNKQIYGTLDKYLRENGKEIDSKWITVGIPYRMPKVWLFELGNGRVVVIQGNPGRGYETVSPSLGDWQAEGRWMWIPGWEYGFGLFSRSIIWASKRESGITAKEIKGSPEKIEFVINNQTGRDIETTYNLKVYNGFYEVEEEKNGKIKLASGENKIELKIEKSLTDKVHIADLILKDTKGRILEWASCKFDVKKDITLTVKMDRDTSAYRSNEEIKGIITIENKGEKKNLKLDIEVVDAYNRVVYKEQKNIEVNPGKNEVSLSIDKGKILDIWHELRVSLLDKDLSITKDRHIFFIYPDRMPLYDDFYLACWGNLEPDPLKIIIAGDKLKEAGIDYVYSYGEGKGERYVAYKTHHLLMGPPFSCSLKGGYFGNRKADTKNLTYDPPLVPSDEEITKFKERMRNLAKGYSEWGGADYIHLDDERDMQGDYDWSERTINKFREWLKENYKSIDALNKQWETNYKDWNEVMPIRISEIKDMNNISQYLDWRIFIGWAIIEYYYKVPAEAVKEGNPRGVVGQHGIYQPSLTIPQDFWLISKYTPVTGRYNGMLEEWFSSFGVISGQYGGYGVEKATPGHRFHSWRSLLHGGHWAFYYILWNAGTHHQGILSPDQTVHGGYNDLSKDEFSDIKKGIGKLFIETEFSDDGICFPYSHSSILASQVLGLPRTGNLYSQKTLIENLGYQHRTLSYEQIKNGELKNFKLLILPNTICLSKGEIDAIKDFVKSGGIVIADYQPGVRDEHGKIYGKKGPLDEVFGIDRSSAEFIKRKMKIKFLKESIFGEKELEMNIAETGVKTTTGKNMAVFEDGTPALIFNNYGKGKGIYLNLEISDYAGMKGRGVAGEVIEEEKGERDYVLTVQSIFEKILENAGLKKRVEIYEGEKPVNLGERLYYKDGENIYFAYMPEIIKETKVKIKTEKKAHIYDLRNKKYVGNTDNFEDILKPGNVKVYSILPYKVVGIDGNLKTEYTQGDNIQINLKVRTDTGKAGKHVLRIEIYKDGKNKEAYNKNLVAEKGELKYLIPLSLNEEKGDYQLYVRDVNSGIEKVFKFKVK